MPDKLIHINGKTKIGVLTTFLKFVGGAVPDDKGNLPRTKNGQLVLVDGLKNLKKKSNVKIDTVQISYFPGLNQDDLSELVDNLKELDLNVLFILMVDGADPMNPKDENKVVDMLLAGVNAAKKHNIEICSSTSIEEWMKKGDKPKTGEEYLSAISQNIRLHTRVFNEADIKNSSIKEWNIEFLRLGEFQTFTNLQKSWDLVKGMNKAIGYPFFKVLIDSSHCGDSDLDMIENINLIQKIAQSDELGIFHASAPTTRGCLSSDDGWIGTLLSECVKTGKLKYALVEIFQHNDEALKPLRDLADGHGVDTTNGKNYQDLMLDGINDIARRLNNLTIRGF
tara:strand:- start:23010 stop:24023 length:1014 start_codon:yes stop_codon:yes gene_type:complete